MNPETKSQFEAFIVRYAGYEQALRETVASGIISEHPIDALTVQYHTGASDAYANVQRELSEFIGKAYNNDRIGNETPQ